MANMRRGGFVRDGVFYETLSKRSPVSDSGVFALDLVSMHRAGESLDDALATWRMGTATGIELSTRLDDNLRWFLGAKAKQRKLTVAWVDGPKEQAKLTGGI